MIIFQPHQIFDLIKQHAPARPIIVEAGAFDGTDTIQLAQTFQKGFVHAFEPVPELFTKLIYNTAKLRNVHCYEQALSDTCGSALFYISEKPDKPHIPSQAGSLRRPKKRLAHSPMQFPYTIEVQTISLDRWAKQNDMSRIDVLWLDTQGHELAILQGAQHILPSVRVIYTEVGFIEAYEDQPTYETVKVWLEEQGFTEIGRTFENTTDWFFGNILMVKK
jgi:FkbM family methyltransferase